MNTKLGQEGHPKGRWIGCQIRGLAGRCLPATVLQRIDAQMGATLLDVRDGRSSAWRVISWRGARSSHA